MLNLNTLEIVYSSAEMEYLCKGVYTIIYILAFCLAFFFAWIFCRWLKQFFDM